jgi:hypothetical protein
MDYLFINIAATFNTILAILNGTYYLDLVKLNAAARNVVIAFCADKGLDVNAVMVNERPVGVPGGSPTTSALTATGTLCNTTPEVMMGSTDSDCPTACIRRGLRDHTSTEAAPMMSQWKTPCSLGYSSRSMDTSGAQGGTTSVHHARVTQRSDGKS